MTVRTHKLISLIMALAILTSFVLSFSVVGLAEEASGSCGDNVTWSYDCGVLTVSGTGDMADYSEVYPAPWFSFASDIQRVVVSDGVRSIGNMAFYQCVNLTTVKMDSSVVSLGNLAFSDCYSLVQIYMPAVKEIGWACFYDCKALVNLNLPSTLEVIGDKAFYSCKSLAGITIPESVTYLGNSAFSYCSNLVYARVLGRLDVLPYWTFYGCRALWELYLPETIETVEYNAVSECPNLYFVDYGGTQEVKQELQKQLNEECVLRDDETFRNDITYSETDGAIITTVNKLPIRENEYLPEQEYGTTISANIKDSSGWDDLIDEIIDVLSSGEKPNVMVQIQDYDVIEQGVLDELSELDITVTIHTSDNVYWDVVFKDQTSSSISGQQNLSVAIVRNEAGSFANLLGDVVTYTAVLGSNTYNTTVRFPLGLDAARQVATLYSINGKKLTELSSVIVDDEGMAAYNVAGTVSGQYLIALNVSGIEDDKVNIPKTLAKEYGIDYDGSTLTDEDGVQYIITGTTNGLGIGLGTLTLIIVSALVGSILLVGGVMVIWNRRQKKLRAGHK